MTDHSAFVVALYAAFGRGDVAFIMDTLDPAIVWESNGDPATIPWGGMRVGPEGALSFFQALGGNLDFEVFEPGAFHLAGETVIVQGRTVARHKHGGRGLFESTWVHFFTLRAGKLIGFQEYYDTAAIERALAI